MDIYVDETKVAMGIRAAKKTAKLLNAAIAEQDSATLILATGASQFEMLESLVGQDVDWSKVTIFHLDEYIGLPITHPASFRKYLKERFVDRVEGLNAFHYIAGDVDDVLAECKRVGDMIAAAQVDVACVGIGENGHLAFNDPPADVDIAEPYIVVDLDDACRRQQLGEGWFPTFDDVPQQAISMSIRQIMKSKAIICTVPDTRKAEAVKNTLEGPVTNMVPASIMQTHPQCGMYLDAKSAALLSTQE